MIRTVIAALALAALPLAAAGNELSPGAVEVTGSTNLDLSGTKSKATTSTPGFADSIEETSSSSVGFEVGALYFVTSHVGLGVEVGYSSEKSWSPTLKTKDWVLMVGPKVGAQLSVAEKLSVFGEAVAVYASGSTIEEDRVFPFGGSTVDVTGYGVGAAAGVKFFPARGFSLDAGVRYLFTRMVGEGDLGVEVTVESRNLGAFAGFSVYFGS